MCLQETHLNNSNRNLLFHYSVFHKDCVNAFNSSGGIAVVVQRSVSCTTVSINTNLEEVAVTVCSLYIPPGYHLHPQELEDLVKQLSSPFLILGDFNAHNPLWGSTQQDARGSVIERFLMSSASCLLSGKQPSFHSPTGIRSSINLSIVHPVI